MKRLFWCLFVLAIALAIVSIYQSAMLARRGIDVVHPPATAPH